MRTVAVFIALALVLVSASSIKAVATDTTAPLPTNWTMTLSATQIVTAFFSYSSDCKTAYANLVLGDGCNPQGNCLSSTSPSLNISGCTVHEGSFRGLSYQMILTTPSTSSCSYTSSSAICVSVNSTATLSYIGSSAKANCVADYESFTANSYCVITANCGALSPSISARGVINFYTYTCSFGPVIGIQANTISFANTTYFASR